MTALTLLIRLAGLAQLALIPVNFVAPYKLRYAASLAGATPVVRNIFYVHAGYIVFVLAGLGALCLGAAEFLGSGVSLARWICCYLSAFWAIRIIVQLFYYDREERRRNRVIDIAFLGLFTFLALVFGAASVAGGRA